jgi:hypothetical protein
MSFCRCLFAGILALVLIPAAQADRKEIVIEAADLAPAALRGDQPAAGKWWLKHDAKSWGAPKGQILLSGRPSDKPSKPGEWMVPPVERFTPYRLPALVIDPRATGWYRIYVGLYYDTVDPVIRPMILARLQGEPYPEYVQAPQHTKTAIAEVLWRAADLTGRTIRLEQPPAPMPHPGHGWLCGISHIRLVPLSDAEVAAARKEIELPPAERRLFGLLDYTDEVFWWGTVESEDDVRAIVYRHRQAGFGRVYWRAFGSHLDHSLAVPEAAPRWTAADEERWCKAQRCQVGWKGYMDLTKKFDPLRVAVEYGEKVGCPVHAWVRFTNFNREPYAEFWHQHPEFRAQMVAGRADPKTGKWEPIRPYKRSPNARVLSLAYPEVRAFYVRFFQEIARARTRGILIDLLRHPPIAGYEPIVSEAFRKKYGTPMEERDVYHDPLVQEHLGSYFRLFLVDLRKALDKDIDIAVRSSGPDKYALRGKEWIDEGLIDTIMDGHWYSGNGPRPTIAATVQAVGRRGRALAIAETFDVDPQKGWSRRPGWLAPDAITALVGQYSGRGVARFGLYESTLFTYYPDLRRAIRAAGWDYDPGP